MRTADTLSRPHSPLQGVPAKQMNLYNHLGAAIAFSPRLDAVLAEAVHHADVFSSRLSLIHAGSDTPEKEARLREAMQKAGIPEDTNIYWRSGPPASAILSAVEQFDIDVLMAGALEKERPLRYYLGSVAHDLVRESPCSLLLLTEPRTEPKPVRRIVMVTDFSEHSLIALSKAIRFAEREGAERVFVIRVLPEYGLAMLLSEGVRRERARSYTDAHRTREQEQLQNLIDAAGYNSVSVEPRCIEGHTGYVAAQFARQEEADLLVMPSIGSHGHFFERLFPSDMEWVLREIPCNLYVVRERMK